MRTFIAIPLSNEIKQELSKIQSEFKQTNADVKWVEPENIHLTLKFLGEVTEEFLPKVKDALTKAISGFKSFEISISGIGAFPKLDYPRAIWVGIEKGKDETKSIAEKLEDELEKLGFAREEREFSAHLTIGRVKSSKNKEALKKILLTTAGQQLTTDSQKVSSITLYQSKLSPHGPTYATLHEAKLLS
ncbi:MAG: RNA 2',3'-cyclic phosphodiesterase [Candidatus Omnitrophica bacterium]|nr:RNA 2',3'-cyclic phosphodiesterase [Candidatus Omnitrophota bacterium]